MAKLYFRYGCVSSAKSLNLLAVAHKYDTQQKKVIVLKPKIDTRTPHVYSRAGDLTRTVDIWIDENGSWREVLIVTLANLEIDCILVDEAQFLNQSDVAMLRSMTIIKDIPVICYGLRTDFKLNLFTGAEELLAIADSIEEIKTTCQYCNSKAVVNLKLVDGEPTFDGPSIEVGFDEKYVPTCFNCYTEMARK